MGHDSKEGRRASYYNLYYILNNCVKSNYLDVVANRYLYDALNRFM